MPRNPTRELLWLAAPMVAMTLSRMMMGFVDFWFVSHLGTAAQAAISPSTLLLFVIACVGMGLAQGVQTFVSQADGRGEPERAGAYVWQTLYIAVAAAILSAPITASTRHWFPLVGAFSRHPLDVQAMEIDFLKYGLWSIGPATACAGLESFYNGIKRPRYCLIGVIAALVTIFAGNWVLIFGRLGFPAMGIAGSGLATLLAWIVRFLVLFVPLMSRSVDQRYQTRGSFRFQAAKMLEIARVGGPVAFQWLVDIGAWWVFINMMMPPYGKETMAGANLALQFTHLSFMPALGVGLALTSQVGNAIGAELKDLAMLRVRVARRAIMTYMGLMAVLFVLGGRVLASLFCFETDAGTRAAVVSAAAGMLIWAGLFQVFDGMCITYSFASRGAGDTRVPALLFAVCCWVIFVLGGYATTWLAPSLGYHGPWMMCMLYIVMLAFALMRRFDSGKWRDIRLFHRAPASSAPNAGPAKVSTGQIPPATIHAPAEAAESAKEAATGAVRAEA